MCRHPLPVYCQSICVESSGIGGWRHKHWALVIVPCCKQIQVRMSPEVEDMVGHVLMERPLCWQDLCSPSNDMTFILAGINLAQIEILRQMTTANDSVSLQRDQDFIHYTPSPTLLI